MKICPVNIIYPAVQRKQGGNIVQNNIRDKTLQPDSVFNYLNMQCCYNLTFQGSSISIYSVDKNGNYQKYNSITDAAKDTGGNITNIAKCLKGKLKTSNGYGFINAAEIEIVDDDGNISIDEKKLKEKTEQICKTLSEKKQPKPFYSVDINGNYKRYERLTDANELGITGSNIKCCLDHKRDTAKGYAFFYADEVESLDEKGNTIVQINMPREKFTQRTPIPVYSIDSFGKIKKYVNLSEAARQISTTEARISSCLSGERETTKGYGFIRADELEVTDDNGRISIDYDKLSEIFKKIIKNAVYTIDRYGNYTRYNNCEEAAKDIGVTRNSVIFCANGQINSIKGHFVVKAKYIETFEHGKVVINEDLLKKFASEIEYLEYFEERPIWVIDKNNRRKKFKNKQEASKTLGISTKKIQKCLRGEQKTSEGYRFAYVKIKELQNHKIKNKIIYAMDKSGNITEFKNIEHASKQLGISKDEITTFLEKGKTRDKKINLKGYVFSLENDK